MVFSLSLLAEVFATHGLKLFDVEELPTHGGSPRILACRTASANHATGPGLAGCGPTKRPPASIERRHMSRSFQGRVAPIKEGYSPSSRRQSGTARAWPPKAWADKQGSSSWRRSQEEGMVRYSVVERSQANAGFDYLRMALPAQRFRQAQPTALLTG